MATNWDRWKIITIILVIVVALQSWWSVSTYFWLKNELVQGWIQQHGFVYDDPGPPDPTKPPPPPPQF